MAAALYAMQQGPEQDLEQLANLQMLPTESEVQKERNPFRRTEVRTNAQGQVIRDRDRKVIREPGTAVIKISIGHNDRVSAAHILSAVAGGSGIPGKLIGAITIQKTYSLVDVPKEYRKSIIEKLNNTKIKGKTVKVL